ncbi:MAG: hypothetical protein HYT07_04165 [Candidatus Levybacteria bacterium]|nr:hypothetical protein [Candidatus Levybacteria bacterium]
MEDTGEEISKQPEIKSGEKESPAVPKNWTMLYHGTNLNRPEWQGKQHALEQNLFTVGGLGLSCITEDDKMYSKQRGLSNTTNTYASSVQKGNPGQEVEMRIIFPRFHSRWTGFREVTAAYANRYGEERANSILDRSDVVHWKNLQGGRHPVLPKGMILDRLGVPTDENGRKVITYIPHELEDVYKNEIKRE